MGVVFCNLNPAALSSSSLPSAALKVTEQRASAFSKKTSVLVSQAGIPPEVWVLSWQLPGTVCGGAEVWTHGCLMNCCIFASHGVDDPEKSGGNPGQKKVVVAACVPCMMSMIMVW